jgi:hypothetical protein
MAKKKSKKKKKMVNPKHVFYNITNRTCLKCGSSFDSIGSGNRICISCNTKNVTYSARQAVQATHHHHSGGLPRGG